MLADSSFTPTDPPASCCTRTRSAGSVKRTSGFAGSARSWPWPSRNAPRRNGARRFATGVETVTRQPPSSVPPGPVSCRPSATETWGSGNSIGVPVRPAVAENEPVDGSSESGPGSVSVAVHVRHVPSASVSSTGPGAVEPVQERAQAVELARVTRAGRELIPE